MASFLLAAVLLGSAWASTWNTAEYEAIRRAMDEDFQVVASREEDLRALITAYQAGTAPDAPAEVREKARQALKEAVHVLNKNQNRLNIWRDEAQLRATGELIKGFMDSKNKKPTLSPQAVDLLEVNNINDRYGATVLRAYELMAEEEKRYADYRERSSNWRLAAAAGAGAAVFAAALVFIWLGWGRERS